MNYSLKNKLKLWIKSVKTEEEITFVKNVVDIMLT